MLLIYLAVGGVLGTLARYGVSGWALERAGGGWLPWGTLIVNVVGCFVLGFATRAAQLLPISHEWRLLVTVGFCGAFTTFSTYSFETVALLQNGEWARASAYAFGSLALGLLAMMLGLAAASPLARG